MKNKKKNKEQDKKIRKDMQLKSLEEIAHENMFATPREVEKNMNNILGIDDK